MPPHSVLPSNEFIFPVIEKPLRSKKKFPLPVDFSFHDGMIVRIHHFSFYPVGIRSILLQQHDKSIFSISVTENLISW